MSVESTQFSAQAAALAGTPFSPGGVPHTKEEWEPVLALRAKVQAEKQAKGRKEKIIMGGLAVVGFGTAVTVTVLLAKFVFNLNPYAAVASTAASIVVALIIHGRIAEHIFQDGFPQMIGSVLLATAITVLCVNPLGFSVTFLGLSAMKVAALASFFIPAVAGYKIASKVVPNFLA